MQALHKWDKVFVTSRGHVPWSSLHPLSTNRPTNLPYSSLPAATTSLGHLCTPFLLVSFGSLLLDCAREPPESKGERYKKCMLRSSIPSCFAWCLFAWCLLPLLVT